MSVKESLCFAAEADRCRCAGFLESEHMSIVFDRITVFSMQQQMCLRKSNASVQVWKYLYFHTIYKALVLCSWFNIQTFTSHLLFACIICFVEYP